MLHSSYSFALAFRPTIVQTLLRRLDMGENSTVLDPFCGTGTTLLESKLHQINSVGFDANPVCVLVTKAKTDWRIDGRAIESIAKKLIVEARKEYAAFHDRALEAKNAGLRYSAAHDPLFQKSLIGRYLESSGLISRGWISPRPALKALLVAEPIWGLPERTRNFLLLSLIGLLVPDISNMSYGPEIYRSRIRRDVDVFGLFMRRVQQNLDAVATLRNSRYRSKADVKLGDSVNGALRALPRNSIGAVITSPPYLSDHDYSRLTRLELVYSGHVLSKEDLRAIKGRLLRSSSKNVYKGDCMTESVKRFGCVRDAISKVRHRAARRDNGFARVYPRLIGEYFGGILAHFKEVSRVLRAGAQAAYIVGDQSSFFATRIPTAEIVAHLAEGCKGGLRVAAMEPIRKYHGTRGNVTWSNQEWLILLRKSQR